ncbi:cytidine/deoxycytidylate deaminase family protein [Candidatus Berkelbacteria bacterium]|nr:cytidine/deoxycytidylate deaminase family protein [Candidatus Berkelbacteria bacterium]
MAQKKRSTKGSRRSSKRSRRPRASWDEYFMRIAETVASRSNCLSPAKGAIIVKNLRIMSTGYNGTPRGTKNCDEGGCQRCAIVNANSQARKLSGSGYDDQTRGPAFDYCVCCHGEENALIQAALNGISTDGSTVYTTFYPCSFCARMIINAGAIRVVARHHYPADLTAKLFKEAKVKLEFLSGDAA